MLNAQIQCARFSEVKKKKFISRLREKKRILIKLFYSYLKKSKLKSFENSSILGENFTKFQKSDKENSRLLSVASVKERYLFIL